MDKSSNDLITVSVYLKINNEFWGGWSYFSKEIQVQRYLSMEEVLGVVKNKYPKFIYFLWKGQTIKNIPNV